jgi:folate-binding protein YgfZ
MADGRPPVNSVLELERARFASRAPPPHVAFAMSSSASDQVAAARRAVLVVPEPDLVAMEVTGKDRITWLNGLLTCELATAKTGDAVYGLAVAQKGRILSDLFVLLDPERALVVVRRAAAAGLAEAFERHLMMEDAELKPVFDGYSVLTLHGPLSLPVLEAARGAGATGGLVDLTGLGGAVLAWPKERDGAVQAALTQALESAAGTRGDLAGWSALRLERAVPSFGADFDGTTYPQEAGLEKTAVSFSKGCYLGQEVVCMLQMRGHVKRKLAALVFEGDLVPAHGARVLDKAGGAEVGQITSSAVSPTLGKPVALAMVKHALAVPGQVLAVEGGAATVVEMPA